MVTVLRSLRWLLSLGKKIGRVAFGHTLLIVCLTLVSQVAALLAAFLPLKVVILLGSEGILSTFPRFGCTWQRYSDWLTLPGYAGCFRAALTC